MRCLLLILVSCLTACASPQVGTRAFEQSITGRHWFETLVHDAPTPLTYMSPSQPYLSQHLDNIDPSLSNTRDKLPLAPPLSPGDRIRVWLPQSPVFRGVLEGNDREFNHIFEISVDGHISLPYLGPILAQGLSLQGLKSRLNHALEEKAIFAPGMAQLDLAIAEWAPITVFVSGAVFNPGQVSINIRKAETRLIMHDNTSGDYPMERLLQTALRSAGGVMPDADIGRIEVLRQGKVYHADLRGVLLGKTTASMPLMSGDMIRVNSVGTAQKELFVPSAITPPGVRVYISNLIRPAFDNASAAVGQHSTSLPYGARMLTAAISGNCAGGTVSTNSDRIVVLVSTDPLTRQPVAIERQLEDLLRAPNRLDLNPFLMPNDSLVCYDSRVTNLRDVGNAISDILFPMALIMRGLSIW